MKKTTIPIFILFVFIIFLSACPYESTVPVDAPNSKINKAILGKWVKPDDADKENHNYYDISKVDNFKYNIVDFEYNTSDSTFKQTKYLAHLTAVKDLFFLNMKKEDEGIYYIHKIDIGKDTFTLFEVTDNIDEKFTDSKDLKAFVEKNMHLSFFYNKDEIKYVKEK